MIENCLVNTSPLQLIITFRILIALCLIINGFYYAIKHAAVYIFFTNSNIYKGLCYTVTKSLLNRDRNKHFTYSVSYSLFTMGIFWLMGLFTIWLTGCRSLSVIELTLTNSFGDPLSDCLNSKACTNCKGTGLLTSFRTMDGTCNRLLQPLVGAAMNKHQRFLDAEYADDSTNFPRGFPGTSEELSSPHKIAQKVFDAVEESDGNGHLTSILFMIFGQFIDHDITLVSHGKTSTKCPSVVSCNEESIVNDFKYPCNPIPKPDATTGCTKLTRTKAACETDGSETNREQVNTITSFVDGSAIYGSSDEDALNLRAKDGSGQLRMSDAGDLLPIDLNLDEMCNQPGMSGCFAAGDTRNSEHIGLAAFHTLWTREHNRIAKQLKIINNFWSGSMIYYTARRIVIAQIQHILFNEWLPKVTSMGSFYQGYDQIGHNPTIANAFAHGAFRFGHTLVPNAFPQLDGDFNYIRPNVGLREAFFNMKPILNNGIEHTILGMVGNESETFDGRFAKAIARHLFIKLGDPTLGDLSAINIHRGRDHGVPPYYKWRQWCTGESLSDNWNSLVGQMKESSIEKLKSVYKHLYDVDLFVGGILELPDGDKIVGKTFGCIIKKQFENLRRGDRFFYLNYNVFAEKQVDSIQKTTMRQILCDNLKDVTSLHDDVFLAYNKHRARRVCSTTDSIDLNLWKEKSPLGV